MKKSKLKTMRTASGFLCAGFMIAISCSAYDFFQADQRALEVDAEFDHSLETTGAIEDQSLYKTELEKLEEKRIRALLSIADLLMGITSSSSLYYLLERRTSNKIKDPQEAPGDLSSSMETDLLFRSTTEEILKPSSCPPPLSDSTSTSLYGEATAPHSLKFT